MNIKRNSTESFFQASDGKQIFYRTWPGTVPIEKASKCFVLLHRGHEHSARLQHIVDELNMPDVPMFSLDARGHGHTEGPRGFSPSVARAVQDIDDFVSYISKAHHIPTQNILVIAQSISAVYAAAWVHDYAPKIKGMILASPALSIKLYVPFACLGMTLWQKVLGRHFYISSYVNANFLTHDPARRKSYNEDPLITKAIASHMLLELATLGKRLVKDARAIKVPVQMFISGSDVVVHHKPQHLFYQHLGATTKEKHVLPGFYHDTFGEQNRSQVFEQMRRFIEQIYTPGAAALHDYTHEDIWGPTADEYRTLQQKLPWYSIKGNWFRLCKYAFNTLGQLSDGLKLGKKTGFNSGVMLDYIYTNKPSGKCLIGKLFDKCYLQTPGWVGIRQRKVNLEQTIQRAVAQLKQENKPVRILDVAAGKGRYILDAISSIDEIESVLLRDYNTQNVQEGTALIKERGLQDKVSFEQADAFDVQNTSAVQPRPTLAVVSGFYEIFPQNDLIEKSLQGIAGALEKDGLLIYTAQPYHPQLEIIARTLRDLQSSSKMWVMRARTQAEMDFLAEKAGFAKEYQVIDENGMFSVSIARKK